MTLRELLTDDLIRDRAGPRYYARGEGYFFEDHVLHLSERNDKITATVAGTHHYRVELWVDGDEFCYACECPLGFRDEFCKHCVATALLWLEQSTNSADKAQRRQEAGAATVSEINPPDYQDWLMNQDKNALADLLLDRAAEDEDLQNRLQLKAAAADFNLATYKKILRQAVGGSRFIDYQEMPDYWRGIDTVINSIEELLEQGHAAPLIELSEFALQQIESALERVDDSDGYMGQLLDRLQDIHLIACTVAQPDPQALAEKLFGWECNGDWDTFRGAALTYAGVLGDKGLTRYRELAEAEWAKIPPLGPGEDDPDRYGRRFNIAYIMENLAHLGGILDELIAVKRRDLSSSYAFLEIGKACCDAGENDQALAWAEKGLAAFGDEAHPALKSLLVELYLEAGRHDDAMSLIWSQFEQEPGLAAYVKLKDAADRQDGWPDWRQRAIEFIRQKIRQAAQDGPRGGWHFGPWSDRSLLVEIFHWEDDMEAAWQEACDGGCTEYLWLRLARFREKDHPRDAIDVYQRQVGPIVGRTNNKAYAEAMVLIRRIENLMNKSGDREGFLQYLATLRSEFKRKRNFMQMLDEL
jgi:uncharacterized Zn finger protein